MELRNIIYKSNMKNLACIVVTFVPIERVESNCVTYVQSEIILKSFYICTKYYLVLTLLSYWPQQKYISVYNIKCVFLKNFTFVPTFNIIK